MANDKKLVREITPMDEDFAQWYTDIVKKAELVDYSSVRGCMIIAPYGYAIWENIQKILDGTFKETGPRECLHAHVYPREPAAEGKGPCGGLCPRSGLGHPWRQRKAGRSACACAPPRRPCSASTTPM